jgi:DNA polymerase IV (DinB-like DNA polymerase)
MDSFYASVEMQRRPDLRGKPVVVGADPKAGRGRGVVCTCSYEARTFGIRSAMPVSQAFFLCPHAVFLSPDYDYYSHVSLQIMEMLRSSGFRLIPVSIDEAFLDVSACGSFARATALAKTIQEMVEIRLGLTCSVGVAPGKTVAKIASDYRKPRGLTVVEPQAVRRFLAPLPVRKVPGVGKRAERELFELGIRSVGDLAESDIQVLIGRFGRNSVTLHQLAQGIDESEFGDDEGLKSLSRETTFDADTDEPKVLITSLENLAAAVHRNLTEEHLRCRTVTVKIRYQGFITRTKSRTLSHYTGEADPIRACSLALLQEMYDGRKVRLIGIRLSAFEMPDQCQQTLGI